VAMAAGRGSVWVGRLEWFESDESGLVAGILRVGSPQDLSIGRRGDFMPGRVGVFVLGVGVVVGGVARGRSVGRRWESEQHLIWDDQHIP